MQTGQAGSQTVFMIEDLTRSKAKLLWSARQYKRNNKIKDCWSADVIDKAGEIYPIKKLTSLSSSLNTKMCTMIDFTKVISHIHSSYLNQFLTHVYACTFLYNFPILSVKAIHNT